MVMDVLIRQARVEKLKSVTEHDSEVAIETAALDCASIAEEPAATLLISWAFKNLNPDL